MNGAGQAKFKGVLSVRVIRANPTFRQQVADRIAAFLRRLSQ